MARDVSRITGTLISMELALGPVVSLRTRALYAVLNSVHSLSCKIALTREAVEELIFGEVISFVCAANQSGGPPRR